MPFPTNSTILDDFNRSNNGTLGADWGIDTLGFGGDAFSVNSNTALSVSSAYCDQFYNVSQYGPACEVFIFLGSVLPQDTGTVQLFLRIQSPGSAAADGYELTIQKTVGAPDTWRIFKITNGAESQVGATQTLEIAANDGIGFQAEGSNLRGFHYTSAAWNQTPIIAVSDPDYSSAGYMGFASYNGGSGNPVFDNFGGGTMSASGAASLTGTAVGGITEGNIVSGSRTIIITLTGDTFIPS